MYAPPTSELDIQQESISAVCKAVKYLNYALLTISAVAVLKTNIFLSDGMDRGAALLASAASIIFLLPYMLALQSLPPKRKFRKTSLFLLPIWSVLVVLGAFSRSDSLLIVAISLIFFLVALIDFGYILLNKNSGRA